MGKAAASVVSSIKKLILGIGALVTLFAVMMLLFSTPTAYIHRKTGFFCLIPPKRAFSYNAIDHGRDYNSLYIFNLKGADTERFNRFAEENENWRSLPIPDELLQKEIGDIEYDVHMREILNAQSGWWYADEYPHDLFVFDASTNILFIRTASVFIIDQSDDK